MKNQFVTYEIAVKLKELGFNEPCIAGYRIEIDEDNSIKCTLVNIVNSTGILTGITQDINGEPNAPLWQQVIDWFDTKKIIITRSFGSNFEGGKWLIGHKGEDNFLMFKASDTKEQAILKAIELITK